MIGLALSGLLDVASGSIPRGQQSILRERWCEDLKFDNIDLADGHVLPDTYVEEQASTSLFGSTDSDISTEQTLRADPSSSDYQEWSFW